MTPDELRAAFETWAREQPHYYCIKRYPRHYVDWPDEYVKKDTWCAFEGLKHGYVLGLSAGLKRAARICERRAEQRFEDYGITEPDTGAAYYQGRASDVYDAMDEEDYDCAAAIREEIKK